MPNVFQNGILNPIWTRLKTIDWLIKATFIPNWSFKSSKSHPLKIISSANPMPNVSKIPFNIISEDKTPNQSIFFSLVHIGFKIPFWNTLGILLGLFTLGILCSIIRLKDGGSLWGAIGLHGGLVGIWFVLNNGLINISKDAPGWLVGYGAPNTNPLGGLYGISLLLISCIFYFLKFKNQIFKFIK